MDWEMVAPMVASVVLFLTVGGVILLRPLSKRLGDLLEAMIEEKRDRHLGLDEHFQQIRDHLDAHGQRLSLLEERVEFAERLMERKPQGELPKGREGEES